MVDEKMNDNSDSALDTQEGAKANPEEVEVDSTESVDETQAPITEQSEAIDAVQDAVDDITQDTVEDTVQDAVEDIAQDAVEDAVQDAVDDIAQDTVEDAVQDAVEDIAQDAVQDAVDDITQDTVEDAVQDAVEDIAQDNVEDAVQDAVDDITQDTVEDAVQDAVENVANETVPDFVADVVTQSDSTGDSTEAETEDSNIIEEVVDRVTDFVGEVHESISEASDNLYQQMDPDKEYVFENLVKPTATGSTMSTNTTPTYQLVPSNTWPPPIYVRPEATNNERFYIEYRWHSQWSYYDSKASVSKKWYQRLQLIIGVGSVTVPVLVGFQSGDTTVQTALQVTTVAISLMVAAAAAIENVFTYGDNWRTFRSAAEELAREKAMYDMRSGPYRRAKNAFLLFTERCEDVIAKQNNAWTQMAEDKGDKDDDDDDKNRNNNDFMSSMVYTETPANYDAYDTSSEEESADVGAAVG